MGDIQTASCLIRYVATAITRKPTRVITTRRIKTITRAWFFSYRQGELSTHVSHPAAHAVQRNISGSIKFIFLKVASMSDPGYALVTELRSGK